MESAIRSAARGDRLSSVLGTETIRRLFAYLSEKFADFLMTLVDDEPEYRALISAAYFDLAIRWSMKHGITSEEILDLVRGHIERVKNEAAGKN
jgi:hypothetical protein